MMTPDDYSTDGETVRAQYDWSSMDPSTGVVEAVAFSVNRDPTDLDPLYDYIDFDALDSLFQSDQPSITGGLSLSFVFDGQHVTVHQDGGVVVRPVSRAR